MLDLQGSPAHGAPSLKVDHGDTDKIAIQVLASNIDADVLDITADAVTTANVIDVSADALTTGTALKIDDNSANTGNRDTVQIIQNHADAINAVALSVTSDGGKEGVFIDKNYSDTAAATIRGVLIDVDKTAATTSDNTIIGVDLAVNNETATNGTNNMSGIKINTTLTHAADAGSATVKAIEATATGGTNGAGEAIGGMLTVTGGDINTGLQISAPAGANDSHITLGSSADSNDLFKISVGANGATTMTTVESGGGTGANLIVNADGAISLDGTGVTINDSSTDSDFRVETNNLQGAILLDAGTDTVILRSNATTLSGHAAPGKGNDVAILLSGTVGSKGTSTRGVSLLAGDAHLSGAFSLTELTSIPSAGGDEALLYAKDDFGVTKLFMKQSDGIEVGPLGSGGSLNDSYDTPDGGGTKGPGLGAKITIDGQPVQLSVTGGKTFALAVTGSAAFGTTSTEFSNELPPTPGNDTNFFVSGSVGTRGTSTSGTSVFGGDLFVSGAAYAGRILSNEDSTSFLDLAENTIEINANHNVLVHAAQAPGVDTNFFVSGSIDSAGTNIRGTSVFGGDVVISGSVYNNINVPTAGTFQRHIKNNNFTINNANEFFFPGSDGESGGLTMNVSTGFLVPYSGSLRKVAFRTQNTLSGNVFRFYVHPGEIPGGVGPEDNIGFFSGSQTGQTTKVYDLEKNQQRVKGGATTSLTVNGNFNFEPGDFITISHDSLTGTTPAKVNVILFLDYDTTSIIE